MNIEEMAPFYFDIERIEFRRVDVWCSQVVIQEEKRMLHNSFPTLSVLLV